ncbi:hypothetical protein RJT34_17508 [Clitoria ternatea]|uniref:3'-5' exonuclease domain-containing protein n=1 Tax=Clitoria ternatea TaxID=43366 RepID=A0AAN9PEL3_CLITE
MSDQKRPSDTLNFRFHDHTIQALPTSDPALVDSWLSNIGHNPIVGLDVEWRPCFKPKTSNPIATLQLSLGLRCLVFQILHAPFIPSSLVSFLADPNHTFVGVGIKEDVQKLLKDHSLRVANFLDLRSLAFDKLGDPQMKNAGIKKLGLLVLGLNVQKPKNVTMSRWDQPLLTPRQIEYAALDAFVSLEIGLRLIFMQKKDISNSNCISKKRKCDFEDVGISSSPVKEVNKCNQLPNEGSPRKQKQRKINERASAMKSTDDSFLVNDSPKKTCNMHPSVPGCVLEFGLGEKGKEGWGRAS